MEKIIENKTTNSNLGEWAFAQNSLKSIILGSGLTNIPQNTFRTNRLTSVTIPESVTSIGNAAFSDNEFPNRDAIIIEGDTTRFDATWESIGFPAKQND